MLCSISVPSFLWNGNGRPVSCGNRTLAPETNRVSDGSRPPKSWQPNQHSVWIMGDTRGLLLLCSLTRLKLIRCTLLNHPLCTPFIHPLCTYSFTHCAPYSFTHCAPYSFTHCAPYSFTHCATYSFTHCAPYSFTHCAPYSFTHCSPTTVHSENYQKICDAHHLKVGSSTGGTKSCMLHTVLFTLYSPAHNALWAGGKTYHAEGQEANDDTGADRAGGKTYHAEGQ